MTSVVATKAIDVVAGSLGRGVAGDWLAVSVESGLNGALTVSIRAPRRVNPRLVHAIPAEPGGASVNPGARAHWVALHGRISSTPRDCLHSGGIRPVRVHMRQPAPAPGRPGVGRQGRPLPAHAPQDI